MIKSIRISFPTLAIIYNYILNIMCILFIIYIFSNMFLFETLLCDNDETYSEDSMYYKAVQKDRGWWRVWFKNVNVVYDVWPDGLSNDHPAGKYRYFFYEVETGSVPGDALANRKGSEYYAAPNIKQAIMNHFNEIQRGQCHKHLYNHINPNAHGPVRPQGVKYAPDQNIFDRDNILLFLVLDYLYITKIKFINILKYIYKNFIIFAMIIIILISICVFFAKYVFAVILDTDNYIFKIINQDYLKDNIVLIDKNELTSLDINYKYNLNSPEIVNWPIKSEDKWIKPKDKWINVDNEWINSDILTNSEKRWIKVDKPINPDNKPINLDNKPINTKSKAINVKSKPINVDSKPINPENKSENGSINSKKGTDHKEKSSLDSESEPDRQSKNINSPLDQFEIRNFLSLYAPILGNFKITLTNITLYLGISTYIALTLSFLTTNYNKIIAHNWSISQESIYATVHSIVINQINEKNGQKYYPFMYCIFILILTSNLIGMIPYSFASTSHFILTFFLSFTIVLGSTILGFLIHKLGFFSLFVPSGCPLGLLFLLVLIEFISYLARNVSLGLRLAANILSGHMLLNILSEFTYKIMETNILYFLLGIIPLMFIIAFSALELGIAFIQSQVFVVLSSSYVKDSLELH